MKAIGNVIWVIFGGLIISFGYIAAGLAMCITIIGIPFGIQAFKLAVLAIWPFGQEPEMNVDASPTLSLIMNVIWLIIAGIWIALAHIFFGALFAITIIGLPFALQHFKLAGLALTPFGKIVA